MLTENTKSTEERQCAQCGVIIEQSSRYCSHCGARQVIESGYSENRWGLLQQASLFYGIDIIVCCLANFIDYFKTLQWLLIFDVIMAVTAVFFFSRNWSENKSLFKWKSFSPGKLATYLAIAIIASCLVHYSVTWLNLVIYNKEVHYFHFFKKNLFGVSAVIFLTAVTPALFEELGYRGYLLSNLLKVIDSEQAVYISAFLFAIIHMSFISLFWLIPFALFLGFVRVKENTIWYGIFVHFAFNLTACLFDLL